MGRAGVQPEVSPFEPVAGAGVRQTSVSNWPIYGVWVASAAALVALIPQSVLWSSIAYAMLLIVGVVGLVVYRIGLTRATRTVAGSGAILGVRRIERITIAIVAIVAAAHGLIIGLWLGAMELWFK
jgi:hypothetical protein